MLIIDEENTLQIIYIYAQVWVYLSYEYMAERVKLWHLVMCLFIIITTIRDILVVFAVAKIEGISYFC